jgi:hypothetical protein
LASPFPKVLEALESFAALGQPGDSTVVLDFTKAYRSVDARRDENAGAARQRVPEQQLDWAEVATSPSVPTRAIAKTRRTATNGSAVPTLGRSSAPVPAVERGERVIPKRRVSSASRSIAWGRLLRPIELCLWDAHSSTSTRLAVGTFHWPMVSRVRRPEER